MQTKDVINNKLNQVLFITELDLKTYTPISANKVKTSLITYIILAQDLYIKKTVGNILYKNLLNEWIANNYDLNLLPNGSLNTPTMPLITGDDTNYQELYLMVRTPLIWWSYVLSLPHIAIKVEEAGVMLNSTDFSESSGMVGLDKLTAEGKMIATSYLKLLKDYICEIEKPKDNIITNVGSSKNSTGIFVAKKSWHKNDTCC